MRRILIVEPRFPNTGGSRIEQFVKHLPAYGWEPIILTQRRPPGVRTIDATQGTEVHSAPVTARGLYRLHYRLRRLGLDEWFWIPDPEIHWSPQATRRALSLIRTLRPDALLTSVPPFSTHLLGLRLQQFARLPWIADWRDLWTQNWSPTPAANGDDYLKSKLGQGRPGWNVRACRRIERSIHIGCTRLIANTPAHASCIVQAHPETERKLSVITNGYDPADLTPPRPVSPSGPMRLGILGKPVSPGPFLEGVRRAILSRVPLELHLIGTAMPSGLRRRLSDPDICGSIHIHPWRPHPEAVDLVRRLDVLVLPFHGPGVFYRATVPFKLYTYLALRRPILALAGEQSQVGTIIRETGAGRLVDSGEPAEIATALAELFKQKRAGRLRWRGNEHEIESYSWNELTGRLARLLEESCASA